MQASSAENATPARYDVGSAVRPHLMERDFSHLYAQLGLQPECSLDALRHAYRRRVSELHPDRRAGQDSDPESQRQLSALIPLYKDALRFHAAHGRLPGGSLAAAGESAAAPSTPPLANPAAVPPQAPRAPAPSHEARSRPQSRRWLLIVPLLLAAYLLVSLSADAPEETAGQIMAGVDEAPAPAPAVQEALALGMSREEVLALQGEPAVRRGENLWEYGPSWVRFDRGQLVAWYSSPLHRLKTRQQRVGDD